jgi:hypothetical protein
MQTIQSFLLERFNNVDLDLNKMEIIIEIDKKKIIIDKKLNILNCEGDDKIKNRLLIILKRVYFTLYPIPTTYDEKCLDSHGNNNDDDDDNKNDDNENNKKRKLNENDNDKKIKINEEEEIIIGDETFKENNNFELN